MTQCCCKKIEQTDDDDDDDIERCFLGTEPCICLPYNDGFVVASQIMSIVAVLASWFWWVTFIISVVAMVILQSLWCCRQRRALFLAMPVVSAIAAIVCVFAGGYFLIVWKSADWCIPFVLEHDDYTPIPYDDDLYGYGYSYNDDGYCMQQAWASVAFVTGILWLAVTGCIIAFVCTGRYAKWERKWNKVLGSSGSGGDDSGAPEAAPEPTPEATKEVPVAEAKVVETKEEETKKEETKEEEVGSPMVESDDDDKEEPPDLKEVASA